MKTQLKLLYQPIATQLYSAKASKQSRETSAASCENGSGLKKNNGNA